MCVAILTILGIILSVIGTVVTLLPVLSITKKIAEKMRTAEALDKGMMQHDMLRGRKKAIRGLIIIGIGALLQIFGVLVNLCERA